MRIRPRADLDEIERSRLEQRRGLAITAGLGPDPPGALQAARVQVAERNQTSARDLLPGIEVVLGDEAATNHAPRSGVGRLIRQKSPTGPNPRRPGPRNEGNPVRAGYDGIRTDRGEAVQPIATPLGPGASWGSYRSGRRGGCVAGEGFAS